MIALLLPVFALVGWSIAGWALAALLWLGLHVLDLFVVRARSRPGGSPASSGIQAFALFFKLDRPARRALRRPGCRPRPRADDLADLRPRVHVRARSLARQLLRNAVAVTRLRILLVVGALALLAPPAALARGTSTRRPSSSSTTGSRSTSGRSTCRSPRRSSTSMLGALLTIAIGIFTMRSRLALLPEQAADDRRGHVRARADADRRSRGCRRRRSGAGSRTSRRSSSSSSPSICSASSRCRSPARPVARRADVGDLRGHVALSVTLVLALLTVRLHALRGGPVQRRPALLQELDPRGAEGTPAPDRAARDHSPGLPADHRSASGSTRTCSPATS